MKRMIKWIWEQLNDIQRDINFETYMYQYENGNFEPVARFLATVWTIKFRVLYLWCNWRGHDYEDHSYGNADSGAISLTCKKCFASFHEQLY